MNDFAVFIMVHGRPEKVLTYETLRKQGYTGKIYLVGDNLDKTINKYKKKHKDRLIIFDKKKAFLKNDSGDNTGDLRSTLYSANEIFTIAKQKKIKWFFIMCDDYRMFEYRYDGNLNYGGWRVLNLDNIFNSLLNYYKKTNIKTIAFAQSGDFMGGENNILAKSCKVKRKAMNTFLCSTSRPFKFVGRMNEDVTTYVNLGSRGNLFFTISNISIYQQQTQKKSGGLTDLYLEYGTYVKSFFSLMYNPSSIRISEIGYKNKRIHHTVKWKNAVPVIIDERHKAK